MGPEKPRVNRHPIRVLGIDTSLRSTGVGIVEMRGSTLSAVEYGTLKVSRKVPLSECLKQLSRGITEIIERIDVQAIAIEGVFYCKNARTSLLLGQARGAVIATCANHGIPIYEYAPRRIKQAIVGFGSAGKEQVRKMVMTLLSLQEELQEDAGDALAAAICHLHSKSTHPALMPGEI